MIKGDSTKMEKQTVFTREDYNKLSAELNKLKTEGRDDIAEKIKEARSHGDLSETAEYDIQDPHSKEQVIHNDPTDDTPHQFSVEND